MMRRLWTAIAMAIGAAGSLRAQDSTRFDHARHAKVFPSCIVCHAGAARTGAPLYPDSTACAACHDGAVERRVAYHPPTDSLRTNLRFNHVTHQGATGRSVTPPTCADCHQAVGAPWMVVQPPVVARCLDCHGIRTAHLEAPDTACATCHLPLASATRLARADISAFPAPASHRLPDFASGAGHGAAASATSPVAQSCATCHTRDFCLACHVDAPERPAIQALASEARGRAIPATLHAPPSHGEVAFLRSHGAASRQSSATCATCHTQESCLSCHSATPQVASALHRAAPDRAPGAQILRRRPASHTAAWVRHHAPSAATATASCANCHTRTDCLECHRPDAARATGYHPADFLARHPAAAYARESSCNVCHNAGQFCVSCHKSAGLVASGTLGAGYHDASRFFIAGHGVAARQSLETCTSCHVERDCLTCHSALGGRRFDPHGPGFDAARLFKKNPEVCTACHGTAIPTH
jgi:hypothetical protein